MASIHRLSTTAPEFEQELNQLLAWESVNDHQLQQTVLDIISRVKQQGDTAVFRLYSSF